MGVARFWMAVRSFVARRLVQLGELLREKIFECNSPEAGLRLLLLPGELELEEECMYH